MLKQFKRIYSLKTNESPYIALVVARKSIKKLFSIDCVIIYFSQSIVFGNIYLFSIIFSVDFEKCELPHIAYIVTH